MIRKVSGWSKKCREDLESFLTILILHIFSQSNWQSANSFPYKCTQWSIFEPFLCLKSCKNNLYAHLSQIWKLMQFTRFIWKVFATKILLSGKFSLFVTLVSVSRHLALCQSSELQNFKKRVPVWFYVQSIIRKKESACKHSEMKIQAFYWSQSSLVENFENFNNSES